MHSYKDAQGFRYNNRKIKVKHIDAYIYHYGWVRNPLTMHRKQQNFKSLYRSIDHEPKEEVEFDYSGVDTLTLFEGTHPAVVNGLLSKETWNFERDIKKKNFKNLKHRVLYFLSQNFGWRPFEYRNYKKI